MKTADHAPGARPGRSPASSIGADEAVPGRRGGVGGEALDERTVLVDEAADRGLDMFGPDVRETRHAAEVEQGVGGREAVWTEVFVLHLQPFAFDPGGPDKAAILLQK